ncbi:hypothetical protein HOD05_00990 [Candidatus Woesearchaeota archaeon]|jgi:hypothetical protein|nr:hypothetical protein [Candidatus Woesearchaeota archaeon]MBT4150983.1 hypothetical protein [Candidatus Woesearchaeota archaeon]MBT4247253.1 hypothetical protein [Candidatus Woesearchaeota archaeon]MBT4433773.1 hypothetical protein [Candidatus Woesearchaeota archaeon]MBT7331894.1 hypothetical protein [Candidatus Woesearchaeota archaeon]
MKKRGYIKLDESLEPKGKKLNLVEKLAKYHEKLFFHLKSKKKQKDTGYVDLTQKK